MAVTNFEVSGDYSSFAPGQIISADVLFTPIFLTGEMATASGLTPPLGFVPTPIKAVIKAGALIGLDGAPVQLVSNSAALNLTGPLFYRVTYANFTAVTMHATLAGIVSNTQQVQVNSFEFEAPTDATPIDLITVTPAPGVTRATGVVTLPASSISDATPFTRGFLTGVTDQASALLYLGAGTGGGGGGGGGLEWEQFATETAFPVPGDALKEYLAQDTGRIYRWDGAEYVTWAPTKAQIGLSDVDNTSDAAKDIAVAVLKNKDLTDASNTFPIFNQNTTGNAATATLAATATTALHATAADSATTAAHATAADTATLATSATLAAAATKLATARNINGVPFDGTQDINVGGSGGGGGEPPITAGTTLQYWRGDKTFQTLNQDVVPSGTTNHAFTAVADARLANTSGTNTGDQTSVSGNAGTATLAAAATKLATARHIDGQSFDGTADVAVIAPATHAATAKTVLSNGDLIPLADSDNGFSLKSLSIATLAGTVKSFYDSVVSVLTNKDLTSATNTFPTFNQSTTGNAATATHATTADSATTATSASVAGSATKLATARTLLTNLASTSGVSFDGTVNASPGVTGTLPVANGGTGSTSFPAGSVLVGNGALAPNVVVPSTAGNILSSNGSAWVSSPPSSATVQMNLSGLYASIPTPGIAGRFYVCTDIDLILQDTGTVWERIHIGASGGGVLVAPPLTGWTDVNLGTATVAPDRDGRLFTAPSTTAGWHLEVTALLSTSNYTATAYIESALFPGTDGYAVLVIRNSVSGSFVVYGHHQTSTAFELASTKFSSPTVGIAAYATPPGTSLARGLPNWLRVRDDGTNRILEYSYNGIDWIRSFSIGRTDFITPDQIGWGIWSNGGQTNFARMRSFSVA